MAAWAPGLETPEAWQGWAAAPAPLRGDGVPDARFLPAMLRRRCTPLSKILLKAAMEACNDEERSQVRTVFSSRHGSINESVGLLENVARAEKLSPAKFSHTVHNAQAGLYSIATGNRQASTSLAAREDSFGCGLLEALGHLERAPDRAVLAVMGDVPLDPVFARLVEEPACAYAVALQLATGGEGPGFTLRVAPNPEPAPVPPWPPAVEFLRHWLVGTERFEIPTPRQRWCFARS
jgi:hypothetical protein